MTTNDTDELKRLVDGLRALADFYETRPGIPLPYALTVNVFGEDTPEDAARIARLMGRAEKRMSDSWYSLDRDFDGITLSVNFTRSSVCTKRVVGTEDVPERIIPAHTLEIVEWDCSPLLTSASEEAS